MISVVIPALDAEARLAECLNAIVPAAMMELVREVIVVDGGSQDKTVEIAEGFGARVIAAPQGRGGQLMAGALAAKGEWYLFLHADTVLEGGWDDEARRFIDAHPDKAAVFTMRFDTQGAAPRIVAAGAMARARIFRTPYGDQGLLISKTLYNETGGYADLPLMEDVDFIRRLIRVKGRGALHILQSKALTSAERYARDGYARRVMKNAAILMRYHLGSKPEALARDYDGKKKKSHETKKQLSSPQEG
ncbi:TIGR04283 family arsenosugar biosynthesis glycosyltransferase [Hyphococcus sp.]|uniref:TIGR04283 family arsenosugar biosynthesis glycosyltransferase n=1 Tax=Hyphococcus sp. TaxID=2038636 RepID=UPI003CCB7478